ncbi:MAG: ABC transporter ATP-binding protein [Desulfonatronovibrionaceae bacterium]
MLEASEISKNFGGIQALLDVSFQLGNAEILGLIGPNGAGKTTLFNALSGTLNVSSGKILFQGTDITALPPQARSRLGIMRTFQNLSLYPDLTLLENTILGANAWFRPGLCEFFRPGEKAMSAVREEAKKNLLAVGLDKDLEGYPDSLSYGNQRKLEIARALTGRPELLLLDEPAAGLNNRESDELADLLGDIRKQRGLCIVVIEHDMDVLMQVSDRVMVLVEGMLLTVDSPENIQKDSRVVDAYLGAEI